MRTFATLFTLTLTAFATMKTETVDYAKIENMGAWLRHPVLGDPSFDTFEKLGATVHVSEPPYDWAVNSSIFRDPVGGAWYYFAGLYPYGYVSPKNENGTRDLPAHFIIYTSDDEGASWRKVGKGFPDGFCFEGYPVGTDVNPDVSMIYDPVTKRYWLAYDWATNEVFWDTIYHPTDRRFDSGGALAYATSPAGPFTRLPKPLYSNYEYSRKLGRFFRAYLTTVFKRESDWIAFILTDSREYYSWGLMCMTAKAPDGEWSEPTVLLSVDRPDYFPAPVESSPVTLVEGTVYASSTSVALNRNYQLIHSAPLEDAHKPEAWALAGDGNAWHSRPLPDERFGIWGQTYQGFVKEGKFTVAYPSRNAQGLGTLSVAQRPWGTPHSDGFTFSGHQGKSLAPLLRAYKDFTLETEFTLHGTVELAFDYRGILGAERPQADTPPAKETLANYTALRLSEGMFKVISVNPSGEETVLAEGGYPFDAAKRSVSATLATEGADIRFTVNGVEGNVSGVSVRGGPLALVAHEFSMMTCTKYAVRGEQIPGTLRYQAYDALLGAGQKLANWTPIAPWRQDCLSERALINTATEDEAAKIYGKWNVVGKGFTVYAPKGPGLGKMRVAVDGGHTATIDLYSEEQVASAPVYSCELEDGRHGIALFSDEGKIVLDILEVHF